MMGAESKVQAPAYRHFDRPANVRKTIRLIAEGLTDQAIADKFGVDQSTMYRFRQRHVSEIEEMQERMLAETVDFAIASKVHRVQTLDNLATELSAALTAHGVVYEEQTRHDRRIHANPAVSELRATLAQAATELDQLPRAGITVNNQNVIIVKQVSGAANGELE